MSKARWLLRWSRGDCLVALALALGGAGCQRCSAKSDSSGFGGPKVVVGPGAPEVRWEWDESRSEPLANQIARPFVPTLLEALRANCSQRFGLPDGDYRVDVSITISAKGEVETVKAFGASGPTACVEPALRRLHFASGSLTGTFHFKLVVERPSAGPTPAGPLRGDVKTFALDRTVTVPKRKATGKCSSVPGSYRFGSLKVQHVRSDLKVERPPPDAKPGMIFEFSASFANDGDEDCYARLFTPITEDGRNLGEDGRPIFFPISSGQTVSTNGSRYSVPAHTVGQIVERYVVPEGVTKVILGVDVEDGNGAMSWLTVDLETGKNELTLAKRPPLRPLPAPKPEPGPTPAPYPGAIWTFPGAGQVEPPLVAGDGSKYPAERAEPHLAAPDGTTYVERWSPARIVCLDGATGHVRWEHPMPPLADDWGRPLPPRLDATRMRLLLASEGLLVVEPRDDANVLVALGATSGKPLWEHALSKSEARARFVAAGPELLIAHVPDATLIALSTLTGAERWRMPLGESCPAPAVRGRVLSPRLAAAAQLWARGERALAVTSCGDGSGQLFTLLASADGKRIWQEQMDSGVSFFWFDSGMYAVTQAGANGKPSLFRGLDPKTGKTLWETSNAVRLPVGSPAGDVAFVGVAPDGTRYFSSSFGEVEGPRTTSYYAVDARSERVVGTATALPREVSSGNGGEDPSFMRDRTPLADGKGAIIRDQAGGRIARVPD